MGLGLLAAIVVAGILLVVLGVHRSGGSSVSTLEDTGQAILEFGKAYPALPIRDVVVTENGQAAFLRLTDARAGLVQAVGRHFMSRLIVPGSIRVEEGPDDRSFSVRFRETTFGGGDYRFASAADAAEVSLWLVGTLLAEHDEAETSARERPGDA